MDYLALIGTVTLIHLLAVISPGPDFVMCLRNSLMYSRRTGMYTAVGFGGGIAVHILYCIAGLAVIISQSILVFNVIKFLGAAYLIFIGYKSLFAKKSTIDVKSEREKKDITPLTAVKIGFLTNVLNPKATLLFLSLFTLVITPQTPASILAVMSTIMIANTILWFCLVAVFFTHERVRSVFGRFEGVFNKTFGGLLILLGIKVALTRK